VKCARFHAPPGFPRGAKRGFRHDTTEVVASWGCRDHAALARLLAKLASACCLEPGEGFLGWKEEAFALQSLRNHRPLVGSAAGPVRGPARVDAGMQKGRSCGDGRTFRGCCCWGYPPLGVRCDARPFLPTGRSFPRAHRGHCTPLLSLMARQKPGRQFLLGGPA